MVGVEEAEVMKEVEDLEALVLEVLDLEVLEAHHGNCRDIGRLYAINFL
jgi:hypothetical protein